MNLETEVIPGLVLIESPIMNHVHLSIRGVGYYDTSHGLLFHADMASVSGITTKKALRHDKNRFGTCHVHRNAL
ncbi:hypothetical protein FGRMN_3934 [Fusarium graminum]|nr:hypothetical protein FGRMN_3934 [Fusarium graminum]